MSLIAAALFAGLAVLGGPIVALFLVGLAGFVIIGIVRPQLLAPALILAGMPFLRPNIWGEHYSNYSFYVFVLAAFIAIAQDKWTIKIGAREFRPVRSTLFWVGGAYLWLMLRVSTQGLDTAGQVWTGYFITAGSALCVAIVVSDADRRRILAKGFALAVVACCFSYTTTVAIWLLGGIGSGKLIEIPVGSWPAPQPLYFPFTTTVAVQPIFGIPVPRFTGFGREPGWMALYGAATYLLLPMLGWRSKIVRLVVALGVLGTVSTGGFGLFIICVALNFMLNGTSRSQFEGFLRVIFGLALIGAAGWAALYAPVLGFDSKGEQNGTSLSERTQATNAGIWAFENNPYSGGIAAEKVGAVNLIASIAAYGLPFAVLMGLAAIGPWFWHPKKGKILPILVLVFLTFLTTQPAMDSAWVFGLLVLCSAVALAPVEPSVRPVTSRLTPKRQQLDRSYKRRFGNDALITR